MLLQPVTSKPDSLINGHTPNHRGYPLHEAQNARRATGKVPKTCGHSLGNTVPVVKEGQACCPFSGKPPELWLMTENQGQAFLSLSFKFPTKKA